MTLHEVPKEYPEREKNEVEGCRVVHGGYLYYGNKEKRLKNTVDTTWSFDRVSVRAVGAPEGASCSHAN